MGVSFINSFLITDPQDYSTTTGDNNDIQIASSIVRITPSTIGDAVTGFAGSLSDGELLFVSNISNTISLAIKHNNSSSSSGNKIFNNSGTDINLPPKRVASYKYLEGTGYVEFNFYQSEIILESAGAIYFGDKNTNGSWRIRIDSGSLVREKRISGVWTQLGADSE